MQNSTFKQAICWLWPDDSSQPSTDRTPFDLEFPLLGIIKESKYEVAPVHLHPVFCWRPEAPEFDSDTA